MAKIYTRTGDDGETGLIGGVRAPKSDLRVGLYGTVDELNASLGVVAARLALEADSSPSLSEAAARLGQETLALQGHLLDLGALLADPERCTELARTGGTVSGLDPSVLEQSIDHFEADLAPMTSFVLPGGCETAAHLHVARTVCRRCERLAVAASAEIAVPKDVLRWLNRLSDWLFTAARWLNHAAGCEERPWRPAADDPRE